MSLSVSINDCTIQYYRYYLTNTTAKNQYIPVFVINVPYTYNEITTESGIVITNTKNTYIVSSNDIPDLITELPVWQVNGTFFLDVYKDDLIQISRISDNVIGFSAFDSDGTTIFTSSGIGYWNQPNVNSVVFTFVRSSDGEYATYSSSAYGIGNNLTTASIQDNVVSGTKKGIVYNLNYYFLGLTYYNNYTTKINSWMKAIVKASKLYDGKDPNTSQGNSSGGGGGGSGDIGGDEHEGGTTPTISALDSGLITLYNPTVTELQSLGKFLWSDSFDVNTFKKLFNDPFDTLLGLSIVPIKPNISEAHNIIFGNLDSGVSSSVVAKQWVPFDCGSLTLNEVWNGALDYAPWTQVSIYLPFIGVKQLNVNDVMGSVLHLTYQIDVLSGACIAEININHNAQGNKSGGSGFSYNANMGCVYTFEGQCATNIPLASSDFTNTIRAAISGVSIAASAAASCATGSPVLGMATLAVGMANAGIQAETPTVERSGQLSGSHSIMASLQPCLFVSRPHICKPERYYALRGVPSQVYTDKLSNCTGYFQIADIENIKASGATDNELTEIKDALTKGVFVDSWPKAIEKESTLQITLYNNTSAKNRIDKNLSAVRTDNVVEGSFRDSCDIENPVIRVRINDVSTLNNLNYMFIGMFQRYYYITHITSMRNRIIEITGHVDVLRTYANEIGSNTGIIARSSQVPAYGNTYLDDNLLATYQDTYNVAYNFPNKFSHDNDNLILAVAGALSDTTT